jgi:organic hydroperoxide reductase OsmC/OhrA
LVETAEPKVVVKLSKGYEFKVTFPGVNGGGFIMDEPAPLGNLNGPNASRLLAASVANCLSASLLFCLRRSKIEVDDMEAEAELKVERNADGYWRVRQINIAIRAKLRDEAEREKAKRCLGIFENYCVVTEAVRGGIRVDVEVSTGRSLICPHPEE